MTVKTILVAVGPSDAEQTERLAEAAAEIAGPTGARVVLGHVFTDDEYAEALDNLEFDVTSSEVRPDDVARRHRTIRDIQSVLKGTVEDIEVRGAVGDHADEIVALAEAVDADRVMVGGRKRSPAGKAVFGSVAQEVMLSAPCPVTFVRSDAE
jgi:nucleotide-binding universal stress UspA family protein